LTPETQNKLSSGDHVIAYTKKVITTPCDVQTMPSGLVITTPLVSTAQNKLSSGDHVIPVKIKPDPGVV